MTVTSTSGTGEGLELELLLVHEGGAVHYDVEGGLFLQLCHTGIRCAASQ